MASSSWDLRPYWPSALAANPVVSPTAGERREPKTRSSPMAQAMAALAALVEPRARARARRERKDLSSNSSRCGGCNSQSSKEKAAIRAQGQTLVVAIRAKCLCISQPGRGPGSAANARPARVMATGPPSSTLLTWRRGACALDAAQNGTSHSRSQCSKGRCLTLLPWPTLALRQGPLPKWLRSPQPFSFRQAGGGGCA